MRRVDVGLLWLIASVKDWVVSTEPEDEAVSVAGLCAVYEAANQFYPTGRRSEGASSTGLPFQPGYGKRGETCQPLRRWK